VKLSPYLKRIQEKMQPGVLTLRGFLGTDTRNLSEILIEDAATVRSFRASNEKIAAALEKITVKATHLMETEVEVNGRFLVKVRDDRGKLPSPWGDGSFDKGDTQLSDPVTGVSMFWNSLSVHMIRSHGFYNGKGSPYRIDPATVIKLFSLAEHDIEIEE